MISKCTLWLVLDISRYQCRGTRKYLLFGDVMLIDVTKRKYEFSKLNAGWIITISILLVYSYKYHKLSVVPLSISLCLALNKLNIRSFLWRQIRWSVVSEHSLIRYYLVLFWGNQALVILYIIVTLKMWSVLKYIAVLNINSFLCSGDWQG